MTSPNEDHIPLHGIKHSNKLIFGKYDKTEMTLYSEEIKYGLSLGYTYEIIDGMKFNRSQLLKDFMVGGFQHKA